MPNNLISEKSPYLLQHAHNPVDWYPWCNAAFERARLEDKPILLSVGYSTCHWCHVMAHESFEDNDIAKIINAHFIAIKVDREERPDIDHIYMTATTAMTGQGGWPLTVFLTPQGEPFYGGTYFPPYAKWGSVGFIDLLNSIALGWESDRDNIMTSSRSMTESLQKYAKPAASSQAMDELTLDRAFRQMRGQFDSTNGGFGSAPKFPMGHNLSFLLRYGKRREYSEALSMVEQSLRSMSQGGIWDHVGGGFHRYSTDERWHIPHFEKMLYDQALLSRAYLEAYQVTGLAGYAQVARDTLDYVINSMTDHRGGFYSAEDADSLDFESGHSKEGSFYVFSSSEILNALGDELGRIFNYRYGVLPQGNAGNDPHGEFIGKNILYGAHSIEEVATHFNKHEHDIQDMLNEAKVKVLALRSQRPRPHLDDKVLCDWNGLMIASFAFASRVLGEPSYAQAAMRAADFILTHMKQASRLLHRWRDGEAGIQATLDDYAFLDYGLIELYEATFEEKYLKAAYELTDGMIGFFSDPSGGFFMTASDAEALIMRPKEAYDGAIPSGNSVAAFTLLKLYALTHQDIYRTKVESIFSCFADSVDRSPYAHSFLLAALDLYLQGPLEVNFQGKLDDVTIAKMLKVLYKHFIPSKAIKFTPSLNDGRVYLCYRGTCQSPINSVDIFEHQLLIK